MGDTPDSRWDIRSDLDSARQECATMYSRMGGVISHTSPTSFFVCSIVTCESAGLLGSRTKPESERRSRRHMNTIWRSFLLCRGKEFSWNSATATDSQLDSQDTFHEQWQFKLPSGITPILRTIRSISRTVDTSGLSGDGFATEEWTETSRCPVPKIHFLHPRRLRLLLRPDSKSWQEMRRTSIHAKCRTRRTIPRGSSWT